MNPTVAWMGLLGLWASGCATSIGTRTQETEQLKSQIASLEGKIGDLNQKVEEVSQRQGVLETEVQATRSAVLSESSRAPKPSAPSKATGSYSKVASLSKGQALSDRQIQQALKTAGFYTGPIDGRIGPKTKQAVRKFQRSNNLTADGRVGARTSAALAKFLEPASRLEGRNE